jgi:hypothetical protein
LENLISEKNTEIVKLQSAVETMQGSLTAAREGLSEAITGYRALLLNGNPGIAPEMINGENIKAINESLAAARNLMSKMKQTVLKELAQNRVPAGAPGRLAPDLAGLSPREKINYGIGGKQ